MVTGNDKFRRGGEKHSARHLSKNDYWEKGHEITGVWVGSLCKEVGIEEGRPVEHKAFSDLALNRHAESGRQLTREVEERKLFCDLVCSAPKTFSLQGVVGQDDRVTQWHRNAVDKVIAEMTRIVGRQAHNGKDHLERTGNFAAARYEHDSSRCQEAQLHTHLVIMNATRSANGKLYAIEFREFLDQSNYLTAVYRDELARQAVVAGLHLTVGEHGEPVIVDLAQMAEEHSTRSKELAELVEKIEEHAGTKLSNPEVAVLVRASRGLDVEKFAKLWDANKAELENLKHLDPETAERDRRELLKRFTEIVGKCSDSRLKQTTTAQVRAEQQARVTPEQRRLLEEVREARALVRLPEHDLDKSLDYAIEHCFQQKSVLKDYELYEAILQHAQGAGINLEQMRARVATHPGLIRGLRGEVGSSEHYQQELESQQLIEHGKGRGVALLPIGNMDRLSELQRVVARSLVECHDQFSALSGSAGVGKTEYVLAEVIKANVAAGKRVAVVAPSDAARDVLHEDASKLAPGPAADVLKAAVSLQLFQANPKLHQRLGRGDLLIIDEASFVSLKQGHQALEMAAKSGYRVLLVGDLDQGKSIDAGDFFRMAIKAGIHTAELHDIKRQSPEALDGHYLRAVTLFKRGRTTEAFRELHKAGCIHEAKGQARIEAIADDIMRSEAAGIPTFAVNITHRENNAVAKAVRRRMTDAGQLRDERIVTVHATLGWSDAQKKDVAKIKQGHVLEITRGSDKGSAWTVVGSRGGIVTATGAHGETRNFTAAHFNLFDVCEQRAVPIAIGDNLFSRSANRKGKLINGERLTVIGWDEWGNPIGSDGRSITHRNLCHAYASTVRQVQGASRTAVIPGYDRHSITHARREDAYVAVSRGRKFCKIWVESIADLSQIQNRSGDRKAVSEMALDPTRVLPRKLRELLIKIDAAREGHEINAMAPEKDVDLQAGKQAALSPVEPVLAQMTGKSPKKHQNRQRFGPEAPRQSREQEREEGMER